jgi:hypothetical protein
MSFENAANESLIIGKEYTNDDMPRPDSSNDPYLNINHSMGKELNALRRS